MNKNTTQGVLFVSSLALLALFLVTLGPGVALADKPEWQGNIDWSIGNHTTDPGQCNCVDQYVATEAACITGGGRACLMQRAIDSAKHGNDAYAFRLTLISQCHNGHAQSTISAAGQKAVGDYLRSH